VSVEEPQLPEDETGKRERTRRCPACGTNLLEESNFCHKCGVPVRSDDVTHAWEQEPGQEQGRPPPGSSAPEAGAPTDRPAATEKGIWSGRPDIRTLAGRFLLAGLGFIAIILGAALLLLQMDQEGWPESESWREPILSLALVLIVVVGIWVLVSIAQTKLTLKYRLTNQRLLIERGFLRKQSEELELRRIEDATVRQGLFDRLTNVGDIILTSSEAADPLYVIVGVGHPFELRETIRRHLWELHRQPGKSSRE